MISRDAGRTPPLDDRFIKALLGEDELGVVIRSHAFVEVNLNRFIELRLEAPEYFEELDLNYARKVELACALGFDARYRLPLKKLGKIRNDFAHDLNAALTLKKINELYTSLPDPGRKAVHLSYGRTKSQLRVSGKTKLLELGAREQFILITLSLERLVMAAVLTIERLSKRELAPVSSVSEQDALRLLPPGR